MIELTFWKELILIKQMNQKSVIFIIIVFFFFQIKDLDFKRMFKIMIMIY